MTSDQAKNLVYLHKIDIHTDFHALPQNQILNILKAADDYNYRPPKTANGSRARYFHAFLKRKIE